MDTTSADPFDSDSQTFVHDQYGHLKDYLLHAEQMRAQTFGLYIAALVGLAAVKSALLSSGGFAQVVDLVLCVATALLGTYAYSSLLYYRHSTWILRLDLDKITIRWAKCRQDVGAYFYLPASERLCELLAKSVSDDASSPSEPFVVPTRWWTRSVFWRAGAWVKETFGYLEHLPKRELELFILLVFTLSAWTMGAHLAHNSIVQGVPGILGAQPAWGNVWPWVPPFGTFTVTGVTYLFFYVEQTKVLKKKQEDELEYLRKQIRA